MRPRKTLRLELAREAHDRRNKALCAFGPRRRHLLAWRPALARDSWNVLLDHLADALVEFSDEDAARHTANAFTYTPAGDEPDVASRAAALAVADDLAEARSLERG